MPSCASNLDCNFPFPAYTVCLAGTEKEVFQCLLLRDQIKSQYRGLTATRHHVTIGVAKYDSYGRHLMIKESSSGKVIATARVLFESAARKAGTFESESKFHLEPILTLPGRLMEIGRIYIHKNHRNPKVVNTLWQGLASLIVIHKIDYLFSTLTISISDAGQYARMVAAYARKYHFAPESLRVTPKAMTPYVESRNEIPAVPPGELKTYLRYGAVVCGDPYWNTLEQLAELFILLDRNAINKRYYKPLAEHI